MFDDLPVWWPSDKPYIIGDCLDGMKQLPDKCVDLIVADPPYGIDYKSNHDNYKNRKRKLDRSIIGDKKIELEWLSEANRILKKDAFLFLFTRWDVIHLWKEGIETKGFKVKERLIWDKTHWGMGDLDCYGTQIEDILCCSKGKPKLVWKKRRGNIIKTVSKRSMPEGLHHPNQKSVKLIRQLIRDAVPKGSIILSPFLGSGTDLEASIKEECIGLGFDINPEYEPIIRKRSLQDIKPLEGYFEERE